jgi:hypothetical protein
VTSKSRLQRHEQGLAPAGVLDKRAAIQLIDAWIPAADGRWLILPRYPRPEKDRLLRQDKLCLRLPNEREPCITAAQTEQLQTAANAVLQCRPRLSHDGKNGLAISNLPNGEREDSDEGSQRRQRFENRRIANFAQVNDVAAPLECLRRFRPEPAMCIGKNDNGQPGLAFRRARHHHAIQEEGR